MADNVEHLLEVSSLVAGYGKKKVLNGVTVRVAHGEVVAVIGHNGAGKSTLLKAVFGMIPMWHGSIRFNGSSITPPEPRSVLRAGMAYVPQGNRVFGDLSVYENLEVAGMTLTDRRARTNGIDRALAEYPHLKARLKQRSSTLSGGERQMLALAMSLVLSPQMILLDEPSLGLAPPLASQALRRVREISRKHGVSVLIVEQKVREVLKVADRVYVLRLGTVSFSGDASELQDERMLREHYL